MNKHNTNTKFNIQITSCRFAVDTVEVLLQLLEFLQHVVVDGGVAEDTDTCCKLHQLAHRFVFASRRRTQNAETPQERGVDAVAVALDDLHAKGLTRVHNVSTLINRKRDEAVLRFHELPHKIQKYFRVSYELRNMKQQKERDKTRNQIISKHILKMNTYYIHIYSI